MTSYKSKAKTIISKNLKNYREKSGLTQIALSMKLNKSPEYISRIEREIILPRIDVLYAIAEILSIKIELLLK